MNANRRRFLSAIGAISIAGVIAVVKGVRT